MLEDQVDMASQLKCDSFLSTIFSASRFLNAGCPSNRGTKIPSGAGRAETSRKDEIK